MARLYCDRKKNDAKVNNKNHNQTLIMYEFTQRSNKEIVIMISAGNGNANLFYVNSFGSSTGQIL
jgi:hypothetical protein